MRKLALALVGLVLCAVTLLGQTSKQPVTLADLEYIGKVTLTTTNTAAANYRYGRGLSLEVVDGVVYIYTGTQSPQAIIKWRAPSTLSGNATFVSQIGTPQNITGGTMYGIYRDVEDDSWYASFGIDYDATTAQTQTISRGRVTAGTFASEGIWTFNRSDKQTRACVGRVPTWFRSVYGGGTHWTGCGGYYNVVTAGPVSMGPSIFDFTPPANGSTATISARPLVAYSYTNTPSSGNRANRSIDYHQNFGSETWPSSVTTYPGNWTWGDHLGQGCTWVDTDHKSSMVCVAYVNEGCVWYGGSVDACSGTAGTASAINSQRARHYIGFYDTADLGAVAGGAAAYSIEAQWSAIQFPGVSYPLPGLPLSNRMTAGVAYEPTQRLFAVNLRNTYTSSGRPEIWFYRVNDATAPAPNVPVAPENLTATAVSTSEIDLEWDDPSVIDMPDVGPRSVSCPVGSVNVAAGSSIQTAVNANPGATTFCLGAGTHVQQTVIPKSSNTFVGAPGAIMDGQSTALYAFYANNQAQTNVTIRGIEIKNYNTPQQYGAISSDTGTNWVVEDNVVHDNVYSGIRIGASSTVRYNSIYRNGVIGTSGFRAHSTVWEHNDIYENNWLQVPEDPVLAAASGIKLGETGTAIVRLNHIHDNLAKGLWTDHSHAGNSLTGNVIEDNDTDGIMVEISCQTTVSGNTVLRNALGTGFPGGGVKVVNSRDVEVTGNTILDNERGVAVNQSGTLTWSCGTLRVENLNVHDNVMRMSASQTGLATTSGDTAVFSAWNNHFTNNDYVVSNLSSPWFLWNGSILTWTQWQAAGNDVTGSIALNPTPITSYRIERSTGGAWSTVTSVDDAIFSYANTGLAEATAYLYRVIAVNSVGSSAPSNTATATTDGTPVPPPPPPPPVPSAPTGVTATATSTTTITVSWTDVTGETSYRVERSTDSATWSSVATPSANVVTFSDSGLTADTSYIYRVFAVNATGDSTASATTTATTPPLAPAAATAYAPEDAATDVTDTTTTGSFIRWNEAARATSYTVKHGTVNPPPTIGTATDAANGSTEFPDTLFFSVPVREENTTYYWQIIATNVTGSTESDVFSYTTDAVTPTAPTNDGYADAVALQGCNDCGNSVFTATGTTVGATAETLETSQTPSVWYTFMGDGHYYQFDVVGDHVIEVFTGTTLQGSVLVTTSADDTLTWQTTSGVLYHLRITPETAVGGFSLNYQVTTGPPPPPPPPPPVNTSNDNWADAILIEGNDSVVPTAGTTIGATRETGEPAGEYTVWYKWVGTGRTVRFHFADQTHQMAAYTGASVDALTLVAQSDGTNGLTLASTVDVTYYLRVWPIPTTP